MSSEFWLFTEVRFAAPLGNLRSSENDEAENGGMSLCLQFPRFIVSVSS